MRKRKNNEFKFFTSLAAFFGLTIWAQHLLHDYANYSHTSANVNIVWQNLEQRTDKVYEWCAKNDHHRFEVVPAPRSYLRLYLRDSSMAVVVPYDTAGKDVYKLLHMMAFDHDHGAAASKDIDYFEEIKRASDLMTDQEKEIIDTKGRSLVIISHPLSRLVNSWHHKFHHLGIEYDQGMKLVQKFNLTELVDRSLDAEAIISLSSLVTWVIDRFNHNQLKDKHFATLINTIVPCKYHFAAVIHIERISKELPLLLGKMDRVDYLKNPHFANELKHVEKRALVRKVYSEQELRKLPLKQRVKLLKAYQEDMEILEYSFNL